MKIAILDLATPYPGMEHLDTAGVLLRDWIAPALPEAEFDIIEIAKGAAFPAPTDHDGYILSGSEIGVYDPAPWIAPLRQFLLAAKACGAGLVGVCFGHQIMADTFGGRAEKLDLGMIVGAENFEISGISAPYHVWHQDQVVACPPGARIAGSAPYCPMAVLQYDFAAYSVQFHPEYTADYLSQEIAITTGVAMTAQEAEKALTSIKSNHVDAKSIAMIAADVLRSASVSQNGAV